MITDNIELVCRTRDSVELVFSAGETLMPVVFATHGGGPLPLLGDPEHKSLIKWMKETGSKLPSPTAILVISAHWEEAQATVHTADRPSLLYDYGGYPPESYKFKYPAPGAPELAKDVAQRLRDAGIPCEENSSRGWDHGVFVPLMLMYPAADIPIVQLSLVEGLEPKLHISIGRAISEFRKQGVLILCSGASYHNLSGMFEGWKTAANDASQFDDYLVKACCGQKGAKREEQLIQWASAPGARASHPREEHLLPLMVATGAAEDETGHHVYSDILIGLKHSCFQFGGK